MLEGVESLETQPSGWSLQQNKLDASPPNGCLSNCRLFNETPDPDEDIRQQALLEAEDMIAKDLYRLSRKERDEILHDIHGVSEIIKEDPEFVARCKNELELNLLRLQSKSRAFQIVWSQKPDYVRNLYTIFLRCDSFDVKKAADRVRCHFDTKLWLFGIDKLCRDIRLDDFDKHDMECYKAGFFQILPVRDRAGRSIMIKLWKLQKFHCRENVWRQLWYNFMTMLYDEATQKNGLVVVIYNVNDRWTETFDRDLFMGVGKIRAAAPIRCVSTHYCFNDPAFGAIIKVVTSAMELHTRTRTRLHYGTDLEVQYELQSFGIPLKQLPVNSEGKFRTKEHLAWLRARIIQEQCGRFNRSNTVIVPGHSDILFGRGKALQSHFGNLRFANLLEDEMERYMQAKRNVKLAIANELVARIKQSGGRFLRQDRDGIWEEVDDKVAADKVGHGFRNRKVTPNSAHTTSALAPKRPVSPSDTSSTASTELPMTVVQPQHVAGKRLRQNSESSGQTSTTSTSTSTSSLAPVSPDSALANISELDAFPLELDAAENTDGLLEDIEASIFD